MLRLVAVGVVCAGRENSRHMRAFRGRGGLPGRGGVVNHRGGSSIRIASAEDSVPLPSESREDSSQVEERTVESSDDQPQVETGHSLSTRPRERVMTSSVRFDAEDILSSNTATNSSHGRLDPSPNRRRNRPSRLFPTSPAISTPTSRVESGTSTSSESSVPTQRPSSHLYIETQAGGAFRKITNVELMRYVHPDDSLEEPVRDPASTVGMDEFVDSPLDYHRVIYYLHLLLLPASAVLRIAVSGIALATFVIQYNQLSTQRLLEASQFSSLVVPKIVNIASMFTIVIMWSEWCRSTSSSREWFRLLGGSFTIVVYLIALLASFGTLPFEEAVHELSQEKNWLANQPTSDMGTRILVFHLFNIVRLLSVFLGALFLYSPFRSYMYTLVSPPTNRTVEEKGDSEQQDKA